MTPLLLLDVDGVLNALGGWEAYPQVWPHWTSGHARAEGRAYRIVFSPDVVDRLRGWHDAGQVELQWLTTWGHDANASLRGLLDLPELVVAGTYQDEDAAADRQIDGAASHAAVAPAAPDPLTGRWWKYEVVRRVLADQPDRTVLWVDDELHDHAGPFRRWAQDQRRVHAIGPAPHTGLTPADLDLIDSLLRRDL